MDLEWVEVEDIGEDFVAAVEAEERGSILIPIETDSIRSSIHAHIALISTTMTTIELWYTIYRCIHSQYRFSYGCINYLPILVN
mmetsp:Transcript_9379/g.10084  ORF Transcript_9379/g.10084 Transcript_9379/m.10084 type:complete len:84 (+) Transcript_9379:193-444(+)